MPRETIDIARFDHGIISSPDPADIPADAASFSLDIDGVSQPGVLRQRNVDEVISVNYGLAARENAVLIEDDGTHTLIYRDATRRKLSLVSDIFGTPASKDLTPAFSLSSSIEPTFQKHNREIHAGFGASAATPPKWIGKVSNVQFGKQPQDTYTVLDAEVTFPQSLPFLHKIVADATYIYGFAFEGDKIYKIKISDGSVTTTLPNQFVKVHAICDEDATYMWVFDAGLSTNGTIVRLKKSDLTSSQVRTLGGHTACIGSFVTDMEQTTNLLWFAYYSPEPVLSGTMGQPGGVGQVSNQNLGRFVFTIQKSFTTSTPSVANRTPRMTGGTTIELNGNFVPGTWVDDGTINLAAVPVGVTDLDCGISEMFKLSLLKLDATHIGWAMVVDYLTFSTAQRYPLYYVNEAKIPTQVTGVIHQLQETTNTNDTVSLIEFNHQPGGYIRGTKTGYAGFVFDGAAFVFYTSKGRVLWQVRSVTPNYVPGKVVAATTLSSAAITPYNSAVCNIRQTGIAPYMTRTTSITGVDQAVLAGSPAALVGTSEVYGGGAVSMALVNSTTDNVFRKSTTYYYKAAFIYDGYQHSPLSDFSVNITNGPTQAHGVNVTFTLSNYALLSPRISDLIIFKASSPSDASVPDGYYRAVATVSLNDPRWVLSGNTATLVLDDNVDVSGASYEALSGMPETLPDTMVNYALSTTLNGSMFVAKCYHPSLPDALHYIFKSKVARYDMYNWATDFIRLPIIPTAIIGFAGRLYAFDENWTYKINPEGMYVEDVYQGAGCFGPTSVLVTEDGMFYCNQAGIYQHTGRQPELISGPLNYASTSANTISWVAQTHTNHKPVMGYHAILGYLLIAVSGPPDYFFAYQVEEKRWDLWSVPAGGTNVGFFNNPDGELYWSQTDALYNIASHPTVLMNATWYSKKFIMNDASQIKKFYKLRGISRGSMPTITYALDESENYLPLTGSPLELTGPAAKAKDIRIKISFSSNSGGLESLSIIARPMIGKR